MNDRYNLEVTIAWPTSQLATALWLLLMLALTVGPLVLAYTLGQLAGLRDQDLDYEDLLEDDEPSGGAA